MRIKKNSKKDLRRWSLIFFQIGMVIVLLISWRAIESKTFDKDKGIGIPIVKYLDLAPEDVIVTETPKTKTPPPLPIPKEKKKLNIVDDDTKIEDDNVETVEDIDEPKREAASIEDIQSAPDVGQVEQEIETLPFSVIQDVPIFPGCEKYKDNGKRKECMNVGVQKFVDRRFNKHLAADLGLSGITRINVQFTVNEHGEIVDVMARAAERELEDEALRVVNMLPTMQPGKQRGNAVKVIYQLSIAFQVN